jgi:hypothetical protein
MGLQVVQSALAKSSASLSKETLHVVERLFRAMILDI